MNLRLDSVKAIVSLQYSGEIAEGGTIRRSVMRTILPGDEFTKEIHILSN